MGRTEVDVDLFLLVVFDASTLNDLAGKRIHTVKELGDKP